MPTTLRPRTPRFPVADVHHLGHGVVALDGLVKSFASEGCLTAIGLVDLPGATAAAGKDESA
ncbi:MAG TPA: hypothetical protein VGK53_03650 [Propionicimonas sp.]|jgi:hypothetical protein